MAKFWFNPVTLISQPEKKHGEKSNQFLAPGRKIPRWQQQQLLVLHSSHICIKCNLSPRKPEFIWRLLVLRTGEVIFDGVNLRVGNASKLVRWSETYKTGGQLVKSFHFGFYIKKW